MAGEVVVGADGTFCSLAAVRWAAEMAVARQRELVLVHAVGHAAGQRDSEWEAAVAAEAAEVVERAAEYVRHREPDLKVRTEVDLDTPARCLVRRSATAALVVVGTRRTSQTQHVYSGSLSYEILAGATCSAAVVPPVGGFLDNRVVVGVDGSADGSVALREAALEAERMDSVLVVVHAWQEPPVLRATGWVAPEVVARVRDREDATLRESVSVLRGEHPGVRVRTHLVQAPPAAALLTAAAHARLLVVGSRGVHGVARVPLGATSHAVILHSRCPVLVARKGEAR